MIEKPAELVPIQNSSSLRALQSTRPMKSYFDPLKYFMAFCRLSVSRVFHSKGRPSAVALPEMTAAVQACAPVAESSNKAAKKSLFPMCVYVLLRR